MVDGQQVLECIAAMSAPTHGVAYSIMAAAKVDAEPRLKKTKAHVAILRTLVYDPGLTDDQMRRATGISHNAFRARRGELTGKNYEADGPALISSTEGGTSDAGNPCARWYLTPLGAEVQRQTAHWRFTDEG
jgi:hypothetical protein